MLHHTFSIKYHKNDGKLWEILIDVVTSYIYKRSQKLWKIMGNYVYMFLYVYKFTVFFLISLVFIFFQFPKKIINILTFLN